MKIVKCQSCGAQIKNFDDKLIICEYCKSHIVNTNKATNTNAQNCNHNTASHGHIHKPQPIILAVVDRPRITFFTTIFSLLCYIFPFLIYYYIIMKKQKEWDAKYKQYNIIRPACPKLDIGLLIICFCFFIIPAFIYIKSVNDKKEQWNQRHLHIAIR